MDFLYIVIGIIVAEFICLILFKGLNDSIIGLFKPMQKFVSKSKKKKVWSAMGYAIAVFIALAIKDRFELHYIWYGILIGVLLSLNDIIFETGIFAKRLENL
ncbi:hypothetical protein [Clostridium sp. UBA7503]|uniref:hypothetical protein n=1 Tax=Clostridium sp. UBA7503 TaxID=1946377 RepID=UPI0032178797